MSDVPLRVSSHAMMAPPDPSDAITGYCCVAPAVDTAEPFVAALHNKAPADVTLTPGLQYNTYFPGHGTSMPKPVLIYSNGVTYDDGTPTSTEQYAKDVSAFLMWASEPHLEARKRIGFQVMIFLIVFAGLLYFTKKKVWSSVKGHA